MGTGTINARGLVSDIDLVFDSAASLNQTLTFNSGPEQNITVNLDMSGESGMTGHLGAGYKGNGSLSVQGGITVGSDVGLIGFSSGSTGVVTVDGAGSTWTNVYSLWVGQDGSGTLNITNGGTVSNNWDGRIGVYSGSTGVVMVDGAGSTLTFGGFFQVGGGGSGTLNITNGASVSNSNEEYEGDYAGSSAIGGYDSGATGIVTVDGAGSTWTNSGYLNVGNSGSGTLNITDGGLVSVAGTLTIDNDANGNGFINMDSGGMLALFGDADSSLAEFLGMVSGTDAICYWDDSISDWADITGAIYSDDYTLSYLSEGDLAGYTMLTVGVVPEPSTFVGLLGLCLAGLLGSARRKS